LKISNFERENVSRVVSLIQGANERLKNFTNLPEEFPKWVLLVLHTSSVEDFKKTFSHLKRTNEVVTPLTTRLPPSYPSIEEMLRVAEKLYLVMSSANEWTGATTKAHQPTFMALGGAHTKTFTSWNCGIAGHSVKDCPKPPNMALREQIQKAFQDAKKMGKKDKKKYEDTREAQTPTGKWALPTANKNNKQEIDDIPRFWLSKTKRWVRDRDYKPPAANVVVPVPATIASTITSPNKELALANATHLINLAMQGLLNLFKDS
jgi:hypothetical protein